MEFEYDLISDLHVDFPQKSLPDLHKNVIVAGDLSNGLVGVKYMNKLQRRGKRIFAIDGNHEHYKNESMGRTIAETRSQFHELLGEVPFRRINEKLYIVGANGWYFVDDEHFWRSYMNDHRAGSAEEVNAQAIADYRMIRETLIREEGMAIVVTHTSPCVETLDEQYCGQESNVWYHNPAMRQLLVEYADKIAVWHHGHTHAFADKIVEGVRIVCNPRGYPGENPNFKPFRMKIDC